jgi:OOP family OmpA-OmpF porin
MTALRTLSCLVFAAAFGLPAGAQLVPGAPSSKASDARTALTSPPRGVWLPGGRSYLGLSLDRSGAGMACSSTALTCADTDRPAQFYTGTMIGNFWGVELAYLDTGRIARTGGEARAQGLALSMVGKTQLLPSVGIFGKFGPTYGRTETTALAPRRIGAGGDRGFGLSFGGGVSFDFTRRLSATVQLDSTDFPSAGGGREPIRSTSLGLKYSY